MKTNALRLIVITLALAAGAAAALAADKGLHVESARQVNLTWNVNDDAGFRWDIGPYGIVQGGSNNAYNGGMILRVNDSNFSLNNSSSARMSKSGDEIEIGPWQIGQVSVSRRVYVNKKESYCRWIDIFENNSNQDVELRVQYPSNVGGGTGRIVYASGKASARDWGYISGDADTGANGNDRPCVVQILAGSSSRVRPAFTAQSGNVVYATPLKIPAGKASALCVIHAQRHSFDEAGKFLKAFRPERAIANVPADLRRIITNMAGATSSFGGIELFRREEADLVVLRKGDELMGTIANTEFTMKTDFGELKLPAKDVLGLAGVSGESQRVYLLTTSGEAILGDLTSGPVTLKLASGGEMNVPASGLSQAAFRISSDRPEGISLSRPMVNLRPSQRLALAGENLKFEFATPHGTLSLSPADLTSIELDTPAGGLHRAIFRNGSSLAGLLAPETFTLQLAGGQSLSAPRAAIQRFIFPGAAADGADLAAITLRNGDTLIGTFTDASWTITGSFGSAAVPTNQLATMQFADNSPTRAAVALHSGTKMAGNIKEEYVGFQLQPGPAMKIYVGQIAAIKGATPKKPTTTGPTSGPTTAPADSPATAETDESLPATPAARTRKMKDLTAILAEQQARLKELTAETASDLSPEQRSRIKEVQDDMARTQKQLAALRQAMMRDRRTPPPPPNSDSPPTEIPAD
jgi:hypothetical protein